MSRTLGYSRASFVRFTCSEQFEDWRDGLISAFQYFGGVPRQVLFDNTKTVILNRDYYGEGLHRWHAGMLECARDYGFQLRVCRPYRPRTKGKVERFNHYLKQSFLVRAHGHPARRWTAPRCGYGEPRSAALAQRGG